MKRLYIIPPSLLGKGVRGLGFALAFPHNVKSQRGDKEDKEEVFT
jgi:hypothetical protein